MSEPSADNLQAALTRYGIELPAEQVALLDRYREELWSMNEQINLTRHTDFDKFVARDVVDSLQLAQLLEHNEKVLDVGTGGGVPGVIVAILRPDLKLSLCESIGKKAQATRTIVEAVGLHIPVENARAEDLLRKNQYQTLVARAVAPIHKMLTWLKPHWGHFDQLLMIKGRKWVEERGEARHLGSLREIELRRLVSYTTPGTDAENVILRLRPKSADER